MQDFARIRELLLRTDATIRTFCVLLPMVCSVEDLALKLANPIVGGSLAGVILPERWDERPGGIHFKTSDGACLHFQPTLSSIQLCKHK